MIKFLLPLFLTCTLLSASTSTQISKDSLVADTNKYYFNKTNHIIIGAGLNYKNLQLNFINNTANLLGSLTYPTIADKLPNKIYDWKFYPTINQLNASVYAVTKYGTFSFSKAITPPQNTNFSKTVSFGFSVPYKKFEFSIDYLKFTGLNRIEPVYQTTTFLKDMSYSPMSFSVEYLTVGRLKNNLLYVPKKLHQRLDGSISVLVSGMNLTVKNPTDFIPALKFKNGNQADSVIQVSGVYVDKFTSTGFYFGPKIDFIIQLTQSKTNLHPNTLYIKLNAFYGINTQKFEYHTLASNFNPNPFHKQKLAGGGSTKNYYIKTQLIYDANFLVAGVGAYYNQQNYGKSNANKSDKTNNNFVSDLRIGYTAYLGFRINATKLYTPIDHLTNRLF